MICKKCGTESRQSFCPRCGEALYYSESLPAQPAGTASPAAEEEPVLKKRKPALRLSMVIWQALALFLPLAYLFFDAFTVLSDHLFLHSASGNMNLVRLMERLSSVLYASNSVSEVTESALGEWVPLTQGISLATLHTGTASAAFWLPIAVTVCLALLCAAAAVLLLLTGGRILRVRTFCNLMLFGGVGAVFSPLLGTFCLRVLYSALHGITAADVMMQRILPSIESLCIMGVLACVLLPALSSLRGIAAYANGQSRFLVSPFHLLADRSLRFKKTLMISVLLVVFPLTVCYFFLPVSTIGSLNLTTVFLDFTACFDTLRATRHAIAAGSGATVNFLAVAEALMSAARPLATVILIIGYVGITVVLWRTVILHSASAVHKKGAKRVLKNAGKTVRGAVLAPYTAFLILQTVSILFLLFGTPLVSHLNFSDAEQTLSVFYLTMAYVRYVGGTQTLYAFMAACGMLLWHAVGNIAGACLQQTEKSRKA